AHEKRDLGAERATVELDRLLAAAIEAQIGLDDHRGLHGFNDTLRTSQEAAIRQDWRFFYRIPAADRGMRLRVGLGSAPARQVFRLLAFRQAQRALHGAGKIRLDRLPVELAAEEIRPQELAERGGLLGEAAGPPQLAGEAAEWIILQLHDGLRDVGIAPAAAVRVVGINHALVIEHAPERILVQRAEIEHDTDDNVL